MQATYSMIELYSAEAMALGLCLVAGILFRVTLSLIGQTWVRTFHHTMTFILLPPITLVVTKVITGNIALSLGMIGALSIVRFRNPVKNPLELVIFFALLTIGIAAGAAIKWAAILVVLCIAAFIGMHFLEKLLGSSGHSLFSLSFEEGNPAHLVEVTSSRKLPDLDSSPALQHFSYSKESGTYSYKLAFRDRAHARRLEQDLQPQDDIRQLQVRYSNSL